MLPRFVLLLLLAPQLASAATLTVTAGQSIQEAVNRAQPGDTVQVGPGTFRQRIDLNGANERLVKVQGTPGQTILDGTGLGNGWMIYGRHVKNMTVSHFEIRNHTGGGIGLFGDTTHVSITDNYVHDNHFVCCQGSGIRVTTRFDPATNRGQGRGVIGTAHHVTIARNTIRNLTTGFTGQLPTNGTESLTVAGDISQFVIEDNLIDRGQFIGIDLIGKSAAWWGQLPGQRPTPATPWPRQGIVRRNTVKHLKLGMGGGDVGIYCDGCRDIVFEHNTVDGASGYCYNVSTEEDGFITAQVILRHNVGINCTSAPFGVGPASSQAHPEGHGMSADLRVVHNTAIRTKPGGPTYRFQWAGGTVAKNNIGVNVGDRPTPYVWHGVPDASAAPQLDHNLYWGGNNYFEHRGRAALSLAEHQTRSGQETHSRLGDPRFTNVANNDVSVREGSAALNQGAPLTQTVGAGSGTVVTVQDSHYFSDGYGMVAGDQVRIGAETARITDVDYATNRLTLDRPLTWAHGDAVSYPYTGSAPDLGACEGVGTCPTSQGAAPVTPPVVPPQEPTPPVTPPAPGPPLAACTHYASPGGGGNGTAQGMPSTIARFWGSAGPGKTLCLLPGTYTGGASLLAVPSSVRGTAGQPVTIRALTDGTVLINGGNGGRPGHIDGQYVVIEGINFTGGDNKTFAMRGSHNLARRIVVYDGGDNGRNFGDTLIDMAGHHNLIEDCAAFGNARKVVGITAAPIPSSGNTMRRCWVRWESNPVTVSNPTDTLELGYGQDEGTFENMVVTRIRSGRVTDPEGMAAIFRTHNSQLLGSVFYVRKSDTFDPHVIVGAADDAGSPPQHGDFHTMTNFLARHVVSLIEPGHPKFGSVRAFHFFRNYHAPINSRIEESVSVAGVAPQISGGFGSRNVRHGTSLPAALGGQQLVWTAIPGICTRYVNRTLTAAPLWPWPMNQRIIDALRQSGRAPVDVTQTMEALLGTIPPPCRGAGGSEAPPIVALPAPRNLHIVTGP